MALIAAHLKAGVIVVVTVQRLVGYIISPIPHFPRFRAQELCESRGGRPGLPSLLNKPTVSVDVKQHFNKTSPSLTNKPYGFCGRSALLTRGQTALSLETTQLKRERVCLCAMNGANRPLPLSAATGCLSSSHCVHNTSGLKK